MRKLLKPISTKSLVCLACTIKPEFKQKPINQQLNWAYRFLKGRRFSIRRISHIGQKMPKEKNELKEKFISETIEKRKNLSILYDESFKLFNMDETACFLDMNREMTIEFINKKNVEILTSGREKYRISVILAVTGDGHKLAPLVIIKGEEGKSIEKNL